MKRLTLILAGLALGVSLIYGQQPGADPWWRPTNPNGQSAGITYGNTAPTTDLVPGELFAEMDNGPAIWVRNQANSAWNSVLSMAGTGTQDFVPTFTATGSHLQDSIIHAPGVPATGTSDAFIDISPVLPAMTAGDRNTILMIDPTNNAGHGVGSSLTAIATNTITGSAAGLETNIALGNGYDVDLMFNDATVEVLFGANDELRIADVDLDMEVIIRDPVVDNAAPETGLMELDPTLSIMDAGGDVQRVLYLDIDNVNHTNGIVRAIDIDLDAEDINANETALFVTGAWDVTLGITDAAALVEYANNGVITFRDAGDVTSFTLRDVPAVSASVDLMELDTTTVQIDAGDTVRGLFVDLVTDAATTGGEFYGIEIDDIVARASADLALSFGTGWDAEIFFNDPTAVLRYVNTGTFTINDTGGANQFWLRDVPVAGTTDDLMELNVTLSIMDDNTDLFKGLFIDIANANHTAAVTRPALYGIDVDLDTGDAQADEYGIHITGTGTWDEGMLFDDAGTIAVATGGNLSLHDPTGLTILDIETDAARVYGIGGAGTVIDIDHGITSFMSLTPTLTANDNASDQRNALLIDVDVPNGSAGLVNAINIDSITDDINTLDAAIFVEGGWDAAIAITERGSAATANPLTGTIWIFLDDSADYSGAGGNDCWLIARDAGGTNNMLFQITLNGACP